MSIITDPNDLENIRRSGQIVAIALQEAANAAVPDITTQELNHIADCRIRELGGEPAFIGYGADPKGVGGYPCAMCTSVNDHVVHALPSENVVLKSGDIVGLDLGVNYNGMITDHAVTVAVGSVPKEVETLIQVTRNALYRALSVVKAGAWTGDIGEAVQTYVEHHHFSVVTQLVGHGVGYQLHEDPKIPNVGRTGTGVPLVENMVIAIEPMVNMGKSHVVFDGEWTVRTHDGSLSAHFEHTLRVTKDGYELLSSV
ncbi:MAG: type I methionyl aminopeptidase [Candidatus Kerfeldbacteria bacterium]|nr:type I methionyl aminopeptidase [Candidatus Kerfeldbacteria bacterium]